MRHKMEDGDTTLELLLKLPPKLSTISGFRPSSLSTTAFTADDARFQMTSSAVPLDASESLRYAVTHVFLPIKPPAKRDYTPENDVSLARAVCTAAHAYDTEQAQWYRITKMLDNLQASVQSEHMDADHIVSQLRKMQTGDILAFFILHQNAAILLTKREDCTLCELFEVSPHKDAVNETPGPLVCSYPESVVEMPNEVLHDVDFQFRLANFLSLPNAVDSDSPGNDLQYMDAFLHDILRNVGCAVDVPRIIKRVHDHAYGWGDVWRRSPLWLLIKVAIQISAHRSPSLGRPSYKHNLLELMSSRIIRRLSKITPAPDWLSEIALTTCAALREIVNARWEELNTRPSPSPFQNPSPDELARDSELSLLNSREYIHSILASRDHKPLSTTFSPDHHRRGTVNDFLSSNGSFFDEAYDTEPFTTIYDVERLVEEGIDDWVGQVADVDEACAQLEILMDQYMTKAHCLTEEYSPDKNSEEVSIQLLTAIELYVALDKLVVKAVPMLADYSPPMSIAALDGLLLRKTTSLHRLSCAYQYLSARHSQARLEYLELSKEFTEDSFPVRYYDQSPDLQQLKAHIEADVMENDILGQRLTRSPLLALPLHALKVVVFELQCPLCVHIWRSAVSRILPCFDYPIFKGRYGEEDSRRYLLLVDDPALRPYFVQRKGPHPSIQVHLAYFYPKSSQAQNGLTLRYVVQPPHSNFLAAHELERYYSQLIPSPRYQHWNRDLESYVKSTSHTSNDVLSGLADCPTDLSLDEFITFAHLRSGGSLQWLNILRGLRSRTLNLRRHQTHYLLSQAVLQVGPFDPNAGVWFWHQELQDPFFCNAFLDELEVLFVDVRDGSIDGVLMSTVSLLLTRMLASSPKEDVAERAVTLLRSVRRKTFSWVQELSYDLAKAPANEERSNLLRDMAATCRSTFDVDRATFRKVLHSPEDVDALLSCAFFVCALRPEYPKNLHTYSQLLFTRDRRISFSYEEVSRDTILADPSDYGVDLAVSRIFVSYKPGVRKWEQLQHPNNRCITCETEATMVQPKQIVHVDLLNGELRVAGQPLGILSDGILGSPQCREILHDQGFFVIPSNLPGMDFMTVPMMSKRRVHFSLRDGNLELQVHLERDKANDLLVLIPSSEFYGDLPPGLVDGHIHWLNPSEKVIEIRPLDQLWKTSPRHWRIDCASEPYRMYRGHETLIDIRSPTSAMVSKCFECLDDDGNVCLPTSRKSTDGKYISIWPGDLLITASLIGSASMSRLSVTLPCYGLSFFVNEREELESCDFKDMVYDENKCVGTLFGLGDLLVLRPKTYIAGTLVPEALIPRRVLVPDGKPMMCGDHQGMAA
ncbi:hypothetical protein L210DRAFT_625817 [Boletus edulis BED1]|uniref:DUF6606 domain-containing protein n=1 Tax=Boletus edulis BED1 TaxID=1328754 RepID=A0AAD4G985_BOLED|nr:hypothetical protein L210DRAFT_625817 [Boletus edulis BED1]